MTAALPHNAAREILFQKMPITSDKPSLRRLQYAALPYRQRQDGEVQIRLITSRETRRWVVPKGWPIKGLTPSQTAAREAYEEAGLIGAMAHAAVGLYSYEKRLSPTRSVSCDVMVFPMKVKRYVKKWPERLERVGFWFSAESAAAAVQEEGLGQLILQFAAALTARHAAKLAAQEEEKAAKSGAKGAHKRKGLEGPAAAGGEAAAAKATPVRDAEPVAAGEMVAKKRAPKKAEAKKPEAKKAAPKKAEAKKAEPKKAASKKAAPKKGAAGPGDVKKADFSAASSAPPNGQHSDDAASGNGDVALGGDAGNHAPEKIATELAKPRKPPAKKSPPGEPVGKKQPNKAAAVKALKAGPQGDAAASAAGSGAAIELRGAAPPPQPTEPSLEDGAGAQPAARKKAGPQKTAAEKNERKKPGSKKAADKKTGAKKAVGKKESAKKASPKKGARDSSLGVASAAPPAAVR
ncbi:NUDIX domain-containing protein [Xanthobacter sp. VNH20]|uniref:NUDIX hydrolase n=1 Tax=Xanthobacter sp. VNH20 TaxID=3156616 RepID=UPI0032B448F3